MTTAAAPPPQEVEDVRDLLPWLMKIGLPGGLLAFIVYVAVTQLVADVHATRIMLEQHVESNQEIRRSQERLEAILRQSCVNAADDYQKRQACWSAGTGR